MVSTWLFYNTLKPKEEVYNQYSTEHWINSESIDVFNVELIDNKITKNRNNTSRVSTSRVRNKNSARKYRETQKQKVNFLESEYTRLTSENQILSNENYMLSNEVLRLTSILHNIKKIPTTVI